MSYKTELKSNNTDLQNILDMILALGLVDAPAVPEADTLNGCSWKNISKIAAQGDAANYWSVGDCKKITLNGTVGTLALSNYETYVYIIGFDHNGASNTIDFGTFKTSVSGGTDVCLIDKGYDIGSSTNGTLYFNINHWGNYNYGGWAGCDMRYDILGSTDVAPSGYGSAITASRVGYNASATCATNPVSGTLMSVLPSELRAVMKPIEIYTDNVAGSAGHVESSVSVSIDYLPLLSEYEIFGVTSISNRYEASHQTQYEYFANGNAKSKNSHNNIASTAYWSCRSPRPTHTSGFCGIRPNGVIDNIGANYANGLSPIFRI